MFMERGDAHGLVYEAQAQLDGLCCLLCNATDAPLESLQPYHLLMLLSPVRERLEDALTAMDGSARP